MMGNTYDIKIGDEERIVKVTETASREITISDKVYIVPIGVVHFIEELAEEIETQQQRKVATDATIDDKINQRIGRMLKALDRRGMLSNSLDAEYPLPPNTRLDCGSWTFYNEAQSVAREGLKNDHGVDLAKELESPRAVARRRL